jgi:hypothetical protein
MTINNEEEVQRIDERAFSHVVWSNELDAVAIIHSHFSMRKDTCVDGDNSCYHILFNFLPL